MVVITGPRQVGKTHLALAIAAGRERAVYLNYDSLEDRRIIERRAWLDETQLLVLDELHKMKGWKNYLKGLYDTRTEGLQILVTGSARLETFRQSGDSLAGRFFRHRLHPLSMAEIGDADETTLERLLERGGFPEPFLSDSPDEARRWRLQYIDGLVRTDVLDFERILDFKAMQTTLELLRRRVGSPVSYASLGRDVGCAPNTIKRYLEIFEALFIIFRVSPFHRNIARSILKEPKIYFYDTGMVVGDEGVRFENLVATALLKHLHAVEDQQGVRTALCTLRTKEKKEVDFVLVEDDEPTSMVEVKVSTSGLSPNLHYFSERYRMPALQLVKNLRHERVEQGVTIRRASSYLKRLSA